jgi:hypothetical protein
MSEFEKQSEGNSLNCKNAKDLIEIQRKNKAAYCFNPNHSNKGEAVMNDRTLRRLVNITALSGN